MESQYPGNYTSNLREFNYCFISLTKDFKVIRVTIKRNKDLISIFVSTIFSKIYLMVHIIYILGTNGYVQHIVNCILYKELRTMILEKRSMFTIFIICVTSVNKIFFFVI